MSEHKHCEVILQNLSLYIDQEASSQLCAEIERHLAGCEDCRVVVDTLRRTISLYRALPQPAMPEHFRERLYRTLHLEAYLSDSSTTTAQNEETREGD